MAPHGRMAATPDAGTAEPAEPYRPIWTAQSLRVPVRGLSYHVLHWTRPAPPGAKPARPPWVLLHGWMDVAASFQFLADALAADADAGPQDVFAPDWRGFGRSPGTGADCYWFPDYLGDLDGLLDALDLHEPVDLIGHSMGGNVAMAYAGVRPARVRRLVNLEGFGLPATSPSQAPAKLAQWLDSLKAPGRRREHDSLSAVAQRLRLTHPHLTPGQAHWLAPYWAEPGVDGRWLTLADPAHKRVNPLLYRVDEALATWRCISAPVLWVEGDRTNLTPWWGRRYTKAEAQARLAAVPRLKRALLQDCGHMLQHEQPQALAALLLRFLD